ncbi:hypothetical protein [uncultured Bacteroides sp.]|uniref:hypothetical protein n=1 Tax=uncultured Bacteroides sp. TaxID=162156 RepID=UPI002AAA8044|nr:hypothetical protein [uncultured Bacteroides sp.]
MKKTIFVLISFMVILSVQGQVQRDYVHPIMSSPTMAEMAKYGNIPVSLSSGTINVSVPITSLKCGELAVPVFLSYNASGIRVHQIASNVGLGWSLNAGGIINCEIIGQSDMMNCLRLIPDTVSFNNKIAPNIEALKIIARGPVLNGDTIFTGSYIDSQPDMFTFNFLGNSGNFVLDKDFKAYIMNDTRKFEIIPNRTDNTFTFKDNKGVIYEFNQYEKTKTVQCSKYYSVDSILPYGPNDPIHTKTIINGYYLTSITSPNGKHYIYFDYKPEIVKYNSPWSAKIRTNPIDSHNVSYSEITNKSQRLVQITTSEGYKLCFKYNHCREDVGGDCKALTGIVLNDPNDNKIQTWILNQDYFEADIRSLNNPELNKRLRLNYLLNVEENNYYRFTYYKNPEFKVPHRNIIGGVDMFGYFNDSPCSENQYQFLFSNSYYDPSDLPTQIVPYIYIDKYSSDCNTCPLFIHEGKSDQYVKESIVDTYSLKEIHYPTGGYSDFKYEAKRSSYGYSGNWAGLRISRVNNFSNNNSLINYKEYQYGMGSVATIPQFVTREFGFVENGLELYDFVHSVPYNSLYAVNGDDMIYSEVSETDKNGRITHYYNSFREYPSFFDSKIYHLSEAIPSLFGKSTYIPIIDFSKKYGGYQFARGLEYKTEYYNKQGIKIKEINNLYKDEFMKGIEGLDVINPFASVNAFHNLYVCLYTLKVGRSLLTSETVNDLQTGIVTKTNYDYTDWNEPKQITRINSSGALQTTQIRYPSDINTGIYAEMSAKRMLNYPIEEILGVQQTFKAALNTYRKENGLIVLDGIYSLNKKGSIQPFDGITFDPVYRKEMTMVKYNLYGNLNEVKTKDNISTSYLWSYKGKYAVAEIKNRSFEQLKTDLGSPYIDGLLESQSGLDTYPLTLIEKLNLIPNVQAKAYTYKLLAGITQSNDPSGRRLLYQYDKALRLSCSMINKQEHLVEYKYKNAQSNNISEVSNNGLCIYTFDHFAVLNNVTFHLSALKESSGNYSYLWTLKNSNGTILSSGSQRTFETDIDEGGKLTVNCSVKDNCANRTDVVSYTFNSYHLPLEMFVDINDEYIFNKSNRSENFKINTKGGSKKKLFTWTLKDSSGIVVKTMTNTDGYFNYIFTENQLLHPLTITCTVSDEITKEVKSITKNIIVNYPPLQVEYNNSSFIGVNIPEVYSLLLHGGSGSFSYQWSLIDSESNLTVYTANSESFEYIQPKMTSSIIVKCLVTDLITNEKKDLHSFCIPQNMIKVKNQVSTRSEDGLIDTITADVWSSIPISTLYTSTYTRQGFIPKIEYFPSWGGMYSSLPAGKSKITIKITGQKGSQTDSGVVLKKYSSENVREGDLQIGGFRIF